MTPSTGPAIFLWCGQWQVARRGGQTCSLDITTQIQRLVKLQYDPIIVRPVIVVVVRQGIVWNNLRNSSNLKNKQSWNELNKWITKKINLSPWSSTPWTCSDCVTGCKRATMCSRKNRARIQNGSSAHSNLVASYCHLPWNHTWCLSPTNNPISTHERGHVCCIK